MEIKKAFGGMKAFFDWTAEELRPCYSTKIYASADALKITNRLITPQTKITPNAIGSITLSFNMLNILMLCNNKYFVRGILDLVRK